MAPKTLVPRAIERVVERLMQPVDAAWLALYRVCFGVLMCISMLRFLAYGWIERFFQTPSFFFKYWGFEWVEPLPGVGMQLVFAGLALCAAATALGLCFRFAAICLAVGLSYVQLIDVTIYLNHYYLAALLAWLLAVSPANRAYSVDAWWRKRSGAAAVVPVSASAVPTVTTFWLYLFRFQVGLVYTFAGLAKAQSDWLLHGQPLRIWLGANTELPLIGPLLTIEGVPLLMSWCGFLFDTTIALWLLLPRTRIWAFSVVVVFHVLTRVLFPIGMFPAIMISSALVFFSPSWPRIAEARVVAAWRWMWARRPHTTPEPKLPVVITTPTLVASRWQRLGFGLGIAYCAIQLVMPLRFLVYPGDVLWHEQGMRFSWRVMVRAKGGSTTFIVRHPESGRTWQVDPNTYLTPMQESEMSSQPDLILQLARRIKRDFEAREQGRVEVFAESSVSLNGRRSVPFIDPNVDLGSLRDGLGVASFVLPAPLETPPRTRPVR